MPRPEKFHLPLDAIRRRILDGLYADGDRLPAEQQLCREFSLSRSCIRKALDHLRQEGLILTEAGNGHFVSCRKQHAPCADTALLMPINFADWSISNAHCLLYSLLEQQVIQQGCRFTHIQLRFGQNAEEVLRQVEDAAAPWIIVDLQAHAVLHADALLWHLLENLRCRVVVTGFVGSSYTTGFDQVGMDWAGGTRLATDYLIRQGHQRIRFAGYDGVDWSDDRRAAFLAALRQAGRWQIGQPHPCIPFPGEILYDRVDRPSSTNARRAAINLRDALAASPADAVICANDALALELLSLAPRDQLPVLLGFDNSPGAKEHGFTSVGMDLRRHADQIFDLLAAPPAPVTQLIRVPTLLATR